MIKFQQSFLVGHSVKGMLQKTSAAPLAKDPFLAEAVYEFHDSWRVA
jgi:hypothetical protein